MSYTYARSPSGDILRVSRCHDGHLVLTVTSASGRTIVPVCIAQEDVAEVIGEMQSWGAPDATSAMPHPHSAMDRARPR